MVLINVRVGVLDLGSPRGEGLCQRFLLVVFVFAFFHCVSRKLLGQQPRRAYTISRVRSSVDTSRTSDSVVLRIIVPGNGGAGH